MIDIVFCSVPWIDTGRPTLAPAVLKSCAQSAGFTAKTIDLNLYTTQLLQNHPRREQIISFLLEQNLVPDIVDDVSELIEQCAQLVVASDPRILGLSLLTQGSQYFTWWFCYYLKSIRPDIRIVIGGNGIKNFIAQSDINFAQEMRNVELINDYIFGDGEHAIVEYLRNNLNYPGINSTNWKPIDDLNLLPYPDFSDYKLNQYSEPGIPLCDSRGCVRSCEFCDVIEHWKKYKYRSAQNVFEEMLYQIEHHGIGNFHFYNSLTNGNMKEFTELLDLICQYNQTHNQQISWNGYFIVRGENQHPESLWQKLHDSNANLMLGIESVIERVRINLGKHFYNRDIDYHLAMGKKYQVPMQLLLIVGYPTETLENFEFTKQWFKDRSEYAGMPVKSVQCTLSSILPGTELERNQEKYNLTQGSIPIMWVNNQTHIDQSTRLSYLNELLDILKEIKMNSCADTWQVKALDNA